MARQRPHPPTEPSGGSGSSAGDAEFPGPPGGPLPPRHAGGGPPGASSAWGGAAADAPAAAAPPSFQRRNRWIGGAVAGVAAVGVTAAFVWAALDEGPPYADLAACEKLLPREAVDGIPGLEGAAVDGSEMTRGETYSDRIVEQVECWTGADDDRSTVVTTISMRRYAPQAAQDDYAPLRRALDRERGELSGGVEIGSSGRRDDAYYGSAAADVAVRPLDAGDDGFTVSYTDADLGGMSRIYGDMEHWAVAQFRDRNLVVQVLHQGTADMSAAERTRAVADLARLVERRTAETAATV
ncbi:hypothetical protein [Streptomonospora litoralis]|uniref:Uncharacterized protein n=1 Tax=Streptomonospora litoralis TaxID=2498135 RepID=A0A4P6Q1V8_9ACTN|nr:hypothetical protein [Streptomonospora litoralis]QBI52819.1 hypothetical protein EKD16_05060 [Streptomonospora litoralis]